MPPPNRLAADDYHFHVYDYAGAAANGPFGLSRNQPQRNNYRFYSMVQDLNGLLAEGGTNQVPNIGLAQSAAATSGGRRTMILSFGNLGNVAGRPTVLITGGIHAREWAATEMAYLLAEYLIVNYNPHPATANQRTLKGLIDSRNIHIIPMLNPDGNHHTVFGGGAADGAARLWRKSRRALPVNPGGWVAELTTLGNPNPPFTDVDEVGGQAQYRVPNYDPEHHIPPGPPFRQLRSLAADKIGVDLNRNMATQAFGYDCGPHYLNYNPSSESYFGPRAGAEVETANLQDFVEGLGGLAASIDYHAFGQLIIYPGEAANRGLVGTDYSRLGETLRQLIRSAAALDYRLGTPLQLVQYQATGSVADYLAQQHQSRAFTVEVDPTNLPPPDPFWEGFLSPQDTILQTFQKNIRGALAALAAPLPATNWFSRLARRHVINANAGTYLPWDVYNHGNQLP